MALSFWCHTNSDVRSAYSTKILTNESCYILLLDHRYDKPCKRHDVTLDTCRLQCCHIFRSLVSSNDHPVITAGCQHHIHQETAHSAISVHIWMDISEKEVSEKIWLIMWLICSIFVKTKFYSWHYSIVDTSTCSTEYSPCSLPFCKIAKTILSYYSNLFKWHKINSPFSSRKCMPFPWQ